MFYNLRNSYMYRLALTIKSDAKCCHISTDFVNSQWWARVAVTFICRQGTTKLVQHTSVIGATKAFNLKIKSLKHSVSVFAV